MATTVHPPLALPAAPAQPRRKAEKAPEHPLYTYKQLAPAVPAYYIRDASHADEALAQLRPHGPFGFDLEWKPNFLKGQVENPVALVQLANASVILLVQVSAMHEFPARLKELLEDPASVKAGVGIQNDCKKLWNDWRVATKGCVDLSLLARSVDSQWKGRYTDPIGLARLTEAYHQLSLAKGKVQRSNWAAMLNPIQQEYAANDAHASYTLYTRLNALAVQKIPVPQATYFTFDLVDGACVEPLPLSPGTGSAPPARRVPFQPRNPEYDPGPPPPPRPPRPPKNAGDGAGGGGGGNGNGSGNGNGNGNDAGAGGSSPTSGRRRGAPLFSNALPIQHARGAGGHHPRSPTAEDGPGGGGGGGVGRGRRRARGGNGYAGP